MHHDCGFGPSCAIIRLHSAPHVANAPGTQEARGTKSRTHSSPIWYLAYDRVSYRVAVPPQAKFPLRCGEQGLSHEFSPRYCRRLNRMAIAADRYCSTYNWTYFTCLACWLVEAGSCLSRGKKRHRCTGLRPLVHTAAPTSIHTRQHALRATKVSLVTESAEDLLANLVSRVESAGRKFPCTLRLFGSATVATSC